MKSQNNLFRKEFQVHSKKKLIKMRGKLPEEIGKVLILLTALTAYAQLIILTQYSFVTLFHISRNI